METTLSALSYATTSENINSFAEKMIYEIKESIINPLEAYAQIKILETAFDKVKKETSDIIQDEVSKLNKGEKYYGFEWQVIEAGIKYDYSECGHSELNQINKDIETLTERKKAIENALKGANRVTIIDEITGEVCNMPVKRCTTTIKMTKK